jgi:hypothetical protein
LTLGVWRFAFSAQTRSPVRQSEQVHCPSLRLELLSSTLQRADPLKEKTTKSLN